MAAPFLTFREVRLRDFIILMHGDATTVPSPDMWSSYFTALRSLNAFDGGSAIGLGDVFRKHKPPGALSSHLTGYIRVRMESLAEAQRLLVGNPVFECGGTVEIRELPRH